MFCPFINGECNPECVFCDNDYHNDNKCQLFKNIISIQSKLSSIDMNTSSDQTDSSSINTILNEISNKLDKLIK